VSSHGFISRCGMSCVYCRSFKQAELTAEMLIHFPGLKNLDKPALWLFPKLLVCLDCGCSHFTVPGTELGSIAQGTVTLGRDVTSQAKM
jgi:hypothetical protein